MANEAQVNFLKTTSGIELNYMSTDLGLYNRTFDSFISAARAAHEVGFITGGEAQYVLEGEFQLFAWNKRVDLVDREWLLNNGFQSVAKSL